MANYKIKMLATYARSMTSSESHLVFKKLTVYVSSHKFLFPLNLEGTQQILVVDALNYIKVSLRFNISEKRI